MRILLVAATRLEIEPLVERTRRGPHQVDVLETGIGMVATAAWCARALSTTAYDFALNGGICGSFDPGLQPGVVVHVVSDRIAELGVEDGDAFISAEQIGLLDPDGFPFTAGALVNADPPANAVLGALPAVAGITVNTSHGHEPSIAAVRHRFAPQVESMEGAAFMYACLLHGVPFAQVRAVSNMVERRNRAAWKLQDAVTSLAAAIAAILDHA
jgi:futalosine hydrolase